MAVLLLHLLAAILAITARAGRISVSEPDSAALMLVGLEEMPRVNPPTVPWEPSPPTLAPVGPPPVKMSAVSLDSEPQPRAEIAIPVTITSGATFGSEELSIADAPAGDVGQAHVTCDGASGLRDVRSGTLRDMTILLRIDSGGRVADERLEVGSGNDRLDRAILECLVTRVVFTPRRIGGAPVTSWQRLHWRLQHL